MPHLSEYESAYHCAQLDRDKGILEVRLHTEQGPLVWDSDVHRELGELFTAIGEDPANRVVVITGTGDAFCESMSPSMFQAGRRTDPISWHESYRNDQRLWRALLDLDVPVIAAVNGPVRAHAEVCLLADIVLSSDTVAFQDAFHFHNGIVAGDGVHILWPLLLGVNRGRYFLLTGETIDAGEAHRLGLVAEVLSGPLLVPRARELAADLARRPILSLRYTRSLLRLELKRLMESYLELGLALEGLSVLQLQGWRMHKDSGPPPE